MSTMNNNYEQEIPKYMKQKESDISKASKKSKHKHEYAECLIQYKIDKYYGRIDTCLASYCTICGKIGTQFKPDQTILTDYRRTIETPLGKCFMLISEQELYDKYHDKMPVFFLENYPDGYVDLDEEQK